MRDGKEATVRESFPLVTVGMVTYPTPDNGRLEMLERALASVRAQAEVDGFTDFEVFIIDDGSPLQDEVYKLASEWGEQMAKDFNINVGFKPLRENSGSQALGFNWVMAMASGKLMAYLDDDNEWDPGYLRAMSTVCSEPGVDMAYCRWRIDPTEGEMGKTIPEFYAVEGIEDDNGMLEFPVRDYDPGKLGRGGPMKNFMDGNFIMHSIGSAVIQCMYPTGILWNDQQARFNDWEFYSRWERNGIRVRQVTDCLGQLHWHGDNLTSKPEDKSALEKSTGHKPRGIDAWLGVRHLYSEQVKALSPRSMPA